MTQSAYESTLPARDTDFIFAVCGEELGMVGCLALLALLSAVVLRCIWVARHASSPFYAYVSMGMAGMLIVQIAANVGMCLFVFPRYGPYPPLHQLWRLLHHHPLCRHGFGIQRQGQSLAQLAAGSRRTFKDFLSCGVCSGLLPGADAPFLRIVSFYRETRDSLNQKRRFSR